MSTAVVLLLTALAVFLIGLARLLPHPTAVRLLDIAGTVLGGVAVVGDLIALSGP